MVDHWRECRRIIARHSRSFDLASRLFPAERRDEVAALYAWCRRCDDAIDLVSPEAHPAALEVLHAELASCYAGEAQDDPVLACFQEVARRRAIPLSYPQELLAGMRMDVDGVRYESVHDLLEYCWRVAGTVGLMMSHLMGVLHERAAPRAAHLGIAMQITNVCRDVAEDWERGRVYLPLGLLEPGLAKLLDEGRQASSPPPLPESAREELARAVRALLDLAERYYASADRGIEDLEPRSALAVRSARLIYAEIGRCLEERDCDVFQGRAVVSSARKLRLVGRALRRYLSERRVWQGEKLLSPGQVLACEQALILD